MKVGTDFSGIGSPEQALKNIGIKHSVVFACEIDKYARQSYLANHECKTMYEDITTRDHSEVPQLDLYVAGFPCQAFSIAGQRKGFDEARGTLFFNVAEFMKENQPKSFILENVKGLLSHDNGKTFQTIISILSDNGGTVNGQHSIPYYDDGLGYHIYYQVLNTKEYGIPQNRERIFIVGFKDYREYRFPITEPLKLKLKDILEYEVEEKYFLSGSALNSIILNDSNLQKSKINPDVASTLQSPGNSCGTYKGMTAIKVNSATKKGYEEANSGRESIYIQEKIRRLTPLECFRLQGFPDDFKKVVSDTQLYKQAGNSITVNVIQKVIENILK